MARRPAQESQPIRPTLTPSELKRGIELLQKRIGEVQALRPATLEKWSSRVTAVQASVDQSLSRVFGHKTVEYDRYRKTVNWAEDLPSLGGETSLEQYREDVTKGRIEVLAMLAAAVKSLQEELEEQGSGAETITKADSSPPNRKVFIVHGHDDGPREAVARFLQTVGFDPIILNEQASQNRTVIEKIEAHGTVGFAVVLLTPDDEGAKKGAPLRPRARQNVLLELGYFMAKLGRSKVCALRRGDVEIPSDFAGVIWTAYDDGAAWKRELARELAAHFDIDWNKVMK